MSLIKDKRITIKVDKKILIDALNMADMMQTSGTFYEDHPVIILLKHIYDNLPKKKDS